MQTEAITRGNNSGNGCKYIALTFNVFGTKRSSLSVCHWLNGKFRHNKPKTAHSVLFAQVFDTGVQESKGPDDFQIFVPGV